jgi:SAM-dependent methyltransferase
LTNWRTVASSEPWLGASRFELARCEVCRTAVTLGEVPAFLHETGAYRPQAPRFHRAAMPVLRAFDRRRLKLLEPFNAPGAQLLDVGAGRGRFVHSALRSGYRARGIEPSAQMPGIIERAAIEDARVPPQSLDVVTVWHVLEHTNDPRAALSRIHGWLRPGGYLLIGVPNLSSVQARIGGERWYHLDVPRHRVHFTPVGISALLAACRFEALKTHHVLAEHNPFGMWQSVASLATAQPSYLYNLLKHNAPLRSWDLPITAFALPLAPIAALAELIAGMAGRGGTIAVIARRLP